MIQRFTILRFILLGIAAASFIPVILYLVSEVIFYPQFLSPSIFVEALGLVPPLAVLGFFLGLCTYGIYRLSQLFPVCRSLTTRAAIAGLTAGILGAYPIGLVTQFVSFRAGVWTMTALSGAAVAIVFGGYIVFDSRKTRRLICSNESSPPNSDKS